MLFEQRTHHSWSRTIGPPPSRAGIAPYDLRALSLDHFEHLKEFAGLEVGHVGRAGWAGRLWGGRPWTLETFWAERGLGSRWELLKTVESRGFASPCLILARLLGFVVGLPNPTHTGGLDYSRPRPGEWTTARRQAFQDYLLALLYSKYPLRNDFAGVLTPSNI